VAESGEEWQTAAGEGIHVFLGSYEHAMDEKGRVSLPARFREILATEGDSRLIVTTNVDPGGSCLVAYPWKEWQAFQERIAGLPQFDEAVIQLKRLHVAGAAECTPDRQGRILIPSVLREYAGLKAEVLFAGLGSSIEIWDKARWEAERARAKQNLTGINEAIARLGL
jgi:MraZ protein